MSEKDEFADRHLRAVVRDLVTRTADGVDVERDLARFHDARAAASSVTAEHDRRPRRLVLLVTAACAVLVLAAGGALLARRDTGGVTSVPESLPASATTESSSATTAGPQTTTSPPTIAPPGTTAPTATFSPTTLPAITVPSTVVAAGFAVVHPSDGIVSIAATDPLQPATLVASLTVPVPIGPDLQLTRVTPTTFAATDVVTGEVTVFDVVTGLVGSTTVATSMDAAALRSIAIGPEDIVYALYAHDLDPVTVTASPLTPCAAGATCTIATWQPGPFCDVACWFQPTEAGFALEGGATVPYVDAEGNSLPGPARPIDPAFTTEYSIVGNDSRPTRVDIAGPSGTTQWNLRIDGILFNNDLYNSFVRQLDGSFTTYVQLEPVLNDMETRQNALLWLTPEGSVAAIDAASIPGLVDVVVMPDGSLIGVRNTGGGLVDIGSLAPTGS